MPVKASPTFIRLIWIELVPMPWMTRSMVPALAFQSAKVSGINSPLGSARTRTNCPARAALATIGALTLISTMPVAMSRRLTIV